MVLRLRLDPYDNVARVFALPSIVLAELKNYPFVDQNADLNAMPVVAAGFDITLWARVANSPDLTIARDLDGDDVADDYVRVFTDLGNLEHALYGLNWGPDGRLYMSKANSKGLNLPARAAPNHFPSWRV